MAWKEILPKKLMTISTNGQLRPGCEFVPLEDENSTPTMKDCMQGHMSLRVMVKVCAIQDISNNFVCLQPVCKAYPKNVTWHIGF